MATVGTVIKSEQPDQQTPLQPAPAPAAPAPPTTRPLQTHQAIAHAQVAAAPAVTTSIESKDQSYSKYKSWRKKYRKMKDEFDRRMDEATKLFVAENEAKQTALRLKQQNNELLELLADINESTLLTPPESCYDLSTSFDERPASSSTANTQHRLKDLVTKATHTTLHSVGQRSLPEDLRNFVDDSQLPGFFTTDEEAASLALQDSQPIDAELGFSSSLLHADPKKPFSEHEFAVHYPLSVHNWLRKHQPHIFAGGESTYTKDGEDMWAAPRRKTPPPSRRSKKDKERIAERERLAELERHAAAAGTHDTNDADDAVNDAGQDDDVESDTVTLGVPSGKPGRRKRTSNGTSAGAGAGSVGGKRKRDSSAADGTIKRQRKSEASLVDDSTIEMAPPSAR